MRTQDIIGKVFTRSFMGYDIEEVDRFLDEVIDCIEQYEAEKKEMMTAMEYLLQKLENGTQLPAAEIREAIDTDKPAKKRAVLPEKTKDVRIPAKKAGKSAAKHQKEKQDAPEAKATARSITRGGGNGAPKPVRAPKVSRVAAPQSQTETKAEELASPQATEGENWLDELLDNLSERDKKGYTTTPEQTAARTLTTTQESAQPPKQQTTATQMTDQPHRVQIEPETPKAQPVTERPKASASPAPTEMETTPQTAKPQPAAQANGEQKEPPMGPQQAEPTTEEALRSFEETLRTLGGSARTEPSKPDENQVTQNDTAGTFEHKPKHAAVSEDEKQ